MSEQSGEEPRARESILDALQDPSDSLGTTVNNFLQAFDQSEKAIFGTAAGGTFVELSFTLRGEERDAMKMQQVRLSLLAVMREGQPTIVARLFEGKEREIQAQQRAWIEREQSPQA